MTSIMEPTKTEKLQNSAQQSWEKTKQFSKDTTAKSKDWIKETGEPGLTKATDKIGVETFWPTSLDREADKAARILRSFCIDGFGISDVGDESKRSGLDPRDVQVKKIPAEVIQGCKGLAIFTAIRQGFLGSRAGGSGIVIARTSDGGWSAPSAVGIGALGVGLQAGADIFDCICVINNEDGMEGFRKVRCTLGGQVGAAAGPLGGGVQIASEVHARQAPVWTYTKGRGLYLGVEVKGTVIVERESENERFYGVEGVRHGEILSGEVQRPDGSLDMLYETLKAAQGLEHDAGRLPPAKTAPDDQEDEVREKSTASSGDADR